MGNCVADRYLIMEARGAQTAQSSPKYLVSKQFHSICVIRKIIIIYYLLVNEKTIKVVLKCSNLIVKIQTHFF